MEKNTFIASFFSGCIFLPDIHHRRVEIDVEYISFNFPNISGWSFSYNQLTFDDWHFTQTFISKIQLVSEVHVNSWHEHFLSLDQYNCTTNNVLQKYSHFGFFFLFCFIALQPEIKTVCYNEVKNSKSQSFHLRINIFHFIY